MPANRVSSPAGVDVVSSILSHSARPMSPAGPVRLHRDTYSRRGTTDGRAEDRHPGSAGRRAALRHPRLRLEYRADPADYRVADGRGRIRDPGRALRRPDGADL